MIFKCGQRREVRGPAWGIIDAPARLASLS